MTNMIEVDLKLFVKCRLCLDEEGKYQIVPEIQMQIKYCFDIEVQPFDGLPHLLCNKCLTIMRQYAGIKQMFQEKQISLKTKLSSNVKIDTSVQQQQDTVSSTQCEVDNKCKVVNEANTLKRKSWKSSTETLVSDCSNKINEKTTENNYSKKAWRNGYIKNFVCRFCSKFFKDKKSVNSHIFKQCKLYSKYSNIIKPFCLVELNKIGGKSNFTGLKDNVVCNKNKIVQSKKARYYVLYTLKSNEQNDSSDSSDSDFHIIKRKRKRQRLISRSSNETVVIEQNTIKSSDDEGPSNVRNTKPNKNIKTVSDIECVSIEDSDSSSTKSSGKTKDMDTELPFQQKKTTVNDKMINNIITMCSNKYINRLNSSYGKTAKYREESSLKHKILSLGRKVIHNIGINAIGLLRYMEHKNLEIVWMLKVGDSKVTIKTRPKEITDNGYNNSGWENKFPSNHYATKDFVDILEKPLKDNTFRGISIVNNNKIINNEIVDKNATIKRNNIVKKKSTSKNNAIIKNITAKKNNKEQLNQNNEKSQENSDNKEKTENTILFIDEFPELKKQIIARSSNNEPNTNPTSCPPHGDSTERKANDNSYLRAVLDSDKHWKKLLNANPVANPKQLPKKANFNEPSSIVKYTNEVSEPEIPSTNEQLDKTEKTNMLHMPIITSTISLAPVDNEQVNNSNMCNNEITRTTNSDINKPQATLPKIKVKPVSELMYDKTTMPKQNSSFASTSTSGWTVNNESPNVIVQSNDNNIVLVANVPTYQTVTPLQPNILYYPQVQTVETAGFNRSLSLVQPSVPKPAASRQYVVLHTVELPRMKTESPFRYFQNLLQIHNIHLLDSLYLITKSMLCLTKFKVVFEQENSTPVVFCLLLYCEKNVFCIKAKDHLQKDLDIALFSANWQWEILKVFKGDDVVPKLLMNAEKVSTSLHSVTTYFINLLKSIVFSKDL